MTVDRTRDLQIFSLTLSQLSYHSDWRKGPARNCVDNVAEWLRRQPAKLMGFARVGSNPTVVVLFFGRIFFSTLHFFSGVTKKHSRPELTKESELAKMFGDLFFRS